MVELRPWGVAMARETATRALTQRCLSGPPTCAATAPPVNVRWIASSATNGHAGRVDRIAGPGAGGQLARRLRVLTHPALLVVDEIGYLPVSREGAVLFFQLIDARHEQASTVRTSNKSFEEWGQVLDDEVMAAALIDRLLHHCHIVNIRGNSYRMRAHQDLLHSASESTPQEEPLVIVGIRPPRCGASAP